MQFKIGDKVICTKDYNNQYPQNEGDFLTLPMKVYTVKTVISAWDGITLKETMENWYQQDFIKLENISKLEKIIYEID